METGSFGGSEPGGRVSFGGQPERNAVTWKAAGGQAGKPEGGVAPPPAGF